MPRLVLFAVFALAVAAAPFVALWLQCRRAAGAAGEAEAAVFGWRPAAAPTVAMVYGAAVAVVGSAASLPRYWPFALVWLVIAAVMVLLGRRFPTTPRPSAVATPLGGAAGAAAGEAGGDVPPPLSPEAFVARLSSREESAGRARRERLVAAVAAVVALGFCGLFSFAAATVAGAESGGDRDPELVAVRLLEGAQNGEALMGSVPAGRPEAGMRVALVITAVDGGVRYRLLTRGPEDAAWTPAAEPAPFADAAMAVAHVRDTYGIERFTLGFIDDEPGPASTETE